MTLFSVHIPKTGGTSFISILKKNFDKKLFIDYHHNKEHVVDKIHKGEVTCVHGHYHAEKYVGLEGEFITWFRNPLDRLVSHYNFWRNERFAHDINWRRFFFENQSFLDFAMSPAARNGQLAYTHAVSLEEYKAIGITEFFDESMDLFRRSLKLDFDEVPHMRRSAPETAEFDPRSLSKRELAKITAFHRLDFDLYARALDRFHELYERDWGDGATPNLGLWGPVCRVRPGHDIFNTSNQRLRLAGCARLRGAVFANGGPSGAVWSSFRPGETSAILGRLVDQRCNHVVLPFPAAMPEIRRARPDLYV